MPNDSNALQVHRVMKGDTRTPLAFTLEQGGEPIDLTGLTVKVMGVNDVDGQPWIEERTTGISQQPTITITANASTDELTASNHRLKEGDIIRVASTGAVPGGLAAGTNYVVRSPSQHKFKVSLPGDVEPIDLTDSGTGTITCFAVGRVIVDLQAVDVDGAGKFWLWLRVYEGSEFDTFPMDGRKVQVEVGEP